jgi:anti-sigma B factor antagonist
MADEGVAFALSHEIQGEQGVLTLVGELDTAAAGDVDDAVDELLGKGVRTLVFDLGQISFIDSSGLRSLIRARQALGAEDAVQLRSPQAATLRLLEITGLEDQFRLI